MTVNDASLGESGSKLSKVAATSLLMGVTRASSEAYIFAVIYDEYGCPIKSSKEAKKVDIPIIEVLPQISAVLDSEKVIKKTTVDGNRFTRLASRNFRNKLLYSQSTC